MANCFVDLTLNQALPVATPLVLGSVFDLGDDGTHVFNDQDGTTPPDQLGTALLTQLPPPTGSIIGTVWNDLDGNGIFDFSDEPGLPGVTVDLFDSLNNKIGTAVTTADGDYHFFFLPLGTYSVKVDQSTLPPGIVPTFDPDGIVTPWAAVIIVAENDDNVTNFGGQFPAPDGFTMEVPFAMEFLVGVQDVPAPLGNNFEEVQTYIAIEGSGQGILTISGNGPANSPEEVLDGDFLSWLFDLPIEYQVTFSDDDPDVDFDDELDNPLLLADLPATIKHDAECVADTAKPNFGCAPQLSIADWVRDNLVNLPNGKDIGIPDTAIIIAFLDQTQVEPDLIFVDGFETDDTSLWEINPTFTVATAGAMEICEVQVFPVPAEELPEDPLSLCDLNVIPDVIPDEPPDEGTETRTPVGSSASFLKAREDSSGIGLATIALAGTGATSLAALVFAWYRRKRQPTEF